jgi:hypothetical protein
MRRTTFAIALILCAVPSSSARADFLAESISRGVIGSGIATSSPGTAVSLDFRPINTDAPYQTLEVLLIFDDQRVTFSRLNVQLDSSPTIFQFLPTLLNNYQVTYRLYDPAYDPNPGPGYPIGAQPIILPQAWRDELADGVLSEHMWIDNAGGTPGQYFLSVDSVFAVPEPGACGVAAFSVAPAALRRRRERHT